MQINNVGQALDQLSVFPRDPLTKRHESDRRRNNGVSVESLFSSSSCGLFGDSIGMESSVDVLNDNEFSNLSDDRKSHVEAAKCHVGLGGSMTDRRFKAERREFPPPISSLARTENLQSRMPWILRRHYTGDGRLVLTEEKNLRHEYFRANRSDGRLTLQLVPLEVSDDADAESDDGEKESDHDHDHDLAEEDKDRDRSTDFWYSDVSIRSGVRCAVKGVTVPAAIRPVHS